MKQDTACTTDWRASRPQIARKDHTKDRALPQQRMRAAVCILRRLQFRGAEEEKESTALSIAFSPRLRVVICYAFISLNQVGMPFKVAQSLT